MKRIPAIVPACAFILLPGRAAAHAFGERYELPVPAWLFIGGGALTVTLTFVILAIFARAGAERYAELRWRVPFFPAGFPPGGPKGWAGLRWASGAIGVFGLLLAVVAGVFGASNPNKNIAPTLVWIVWWVGLSYVAMLIGNIWPLLDPWRAIYDALARRSGRPFRAYPARLGAWPAVALLLLFGWIELVFPFAATPAALAGIIAVYSVLNWTGMAVYGPEVWRANADPFHRAFDLLSRFAPVAARPGEGMVVRPYAAGLLASEDNARATPIVGFVLAMLAIVLFDGFQNSTHWTALENAIHAINPKTGELGWLSVHTAGLVVLWLVFLGLYYLACAAARLAAGGAISTGQYARAFVLTLIPISVGYHFAHTFTSILVQGQTIVPLASDPLGRGWNLFGTREAAINIAVMNTKTAWYLALSAIVIGHAISVYLAHATAERLLTERGRALRALVPITGLMILFTILSLQILAEPLVRYTPPPDTII